MISFGSDEVWPSLGYIGIALAVIAVIVGIVAWRGKKKGSRTIALDAALAISGWWVMLAGVGAVIIVIKAFSVDFAEFHGTTNVWTAWPADLPCSEFGDSESTMLTCGGNALTDFTVGNASLGLRLLSAAAQLTTAALTIMPAVILAIICFQTLRGATFSRIVTRALTGGAIAVLVLGVASDLLGSIAATAGLREVFEPSSEWYPWGFQLTVTPLPFVGALALVALAAVFREGSRLQQEREQLAQETARLQKDTEGLV
jgi:hypothetical protein